MNFKREGKRNILATTATAVLPGILLTPSAWSQSNDEEKMGLLEEVVVTATYRSVSVQDLPMAVTALTGEALDDLGATEIQDYYRTVPNFSVVDRGPGQRIYTLRGVSTGLVTQSPATVGVYVDNVPISAGGLQPDLKIFDLERIEVLRGPQGTLYGAGSMGGTLRMITPDPDPSAFSGKVDGSYSDTENGGDNKSASAVLNIPIIEETLALRASGFYADWSGFIDRTGQPGGVVVDTGAALGAPPGVLPVLESGPISVREDINDEETYSGRVSLLWNATENLSFNLSYLSQKSEFGGRPVESNNFGDYQTDFYLPEELDDDLDLYNLTVKHQFSWADVLLSSSYWDRSVSRLADNADLGNSIVPGVKLAGTGTFTDDYQKETTHELRFTSVSDGQLTWLLGFFYQDKDNGFEQNIDDQLNFFVDFANVLGVPVTNERQLLDQSGDFEEDQFAVYGEVGYAFTDQWSAEIGLRYFDYDQTTTIVNNDINALGLGLADGVYKADDDGVNPKFTVRYTPSDNSMFYATAVEGYRVGGVNTAPGIPENLIAYGPDSLWSYEIGSKVSFNDGRLLLNTAVFYIDWTDIQLALPVDFSFATVNAGEAEVIGVELELAWQVTDSFELTGSLGYNEGELSEDVPEADNPANPNPGFKGDTLPGVPDLTAAVAAQYTAPFFQSDYEWFTRVDYQYTGESQTTFNEQSVANGQSSYFELDSYGLWNLRLGVRNEVWGATLYADNLTDERAILLRDNAAVALRTTINRPRTIGVKLSMNF